MGLCAWVLQQSLRARIAVNKFVQAHAQTCRSAMMGTA